MTNKLQTAFASLVLMGAASVAAAQTGGLIGERFGALDLGYVDFDDGGHLTTGGVVLNVPSTIKGLDLGIDVGYANGGYQSLDTEAYAVGVSGTGYVELEHGIKPFLSGRFGWERDEASMWGLSGHDDSFVYSLKVGVEVPVTSKAAIRASFGYYDYTSYRDGDGLTASLGANYWITAKFGALVGYTRDFEDDSNTFSIGVILRY
ncbi:MAG TPA: hypothetical protein VK178_00605 [Opitutaceae bacterium]|nr:hypothetical protein [Opitutaceae bacterium]